MSGNGDLKTQDGKDSGAEASSPVSQDQHPFLDTEEELEEGKRDAPYVQSLDDADKCVEQIPNEGKDTQEAEGQSVVEIVRELISEEVSASQNVIEYVKSIVVSGDGGSSGHSRSSSSSSSSDDESRDTKSSKVVNLEEKHDFVSGTAPDELIEPDSAMSEGAFYDAKSAPVDEAFNSVAETVSVADSIKPEVCSSEEVILVSETAPVGYSVNPDVSLPEEAASVDKGLLGEESYISAVEAASVVDLVKPEVSVPREVIYVTDSASLGNSVSELGFKENEEKKLPASAILDSASQKIHDKVFPIPEEGAGLSSTIASSEVLENEDEPLPSSDAPNFETSSVTEHVKHYEDPECSEKQVLPLESS